MMRQFELLETIKSYDANADEELLNRAWERPANLPSMEEIQLPELWISRIKENPDQASSIEP